MGSRDSSSRRRDPGTAELLRGGRHSGLAPVRAIHQRRWLHWGLGAVLAAAILIAYGNSFPGAFYFDDEGAIVVNKSIRHLGDWRAVLWPPVEAGIGGRPFANLTFALNYHFHQLRPWGFHAVNVGIHLAGALLLCGIVRRTLLSPSLRVQFGSIALPAAVLAAATWGLHPVAMNVVNYMSQRTESLMAALYLMTLYAFIRAASSGSHAWSAVAFLACLAGMASKEVMATAPIAVLLYDRVYLSASWRQLLARNGARHLALFGTWVLLGLLMVFSKLGQRGVGFDLGPSAWEYALTETQAILRYLQLTFWPQPLVFDYGPEFVRHFSEAWPAVAGLLAALAGTVVAWRKSPRVGYALLWFFLVLAPSSSVIPVVQQPCAENRIYLPMVGPLVLIVVLIHRMIGRRASWLLAALPIALGLVTYQRNPDFRSELAIWWDTTYKRPENERAANNLGNALLKLDRAADAMPHLDRAIELSPTYADPYNNRGVALLRLRQPEKALAEFETAARLKKRYADAHYNMGEAYLQLGRPADAIAALERSLEMNPNNPKAHNNLGIALLDTGRIDESIAAERRALELNPEMPEAYYNLGNSLARAGRADEALAAYDTALRLKPDFARAHNNAGVIHLRHGRRAEAAARFEAALRIDPNYPEARRNLAVVQGQ